MDALDWYHGKLAFSVHENAMACHHGVAKVVVPIPLHAFEPFKSADVDVFVVFADVFSNGNPLVGLAWLWWIVKMVEGAVSIKAWDEV